MQEISVDHSEVARLAELLEELPQVVGDAKRQAFEAAAPRLQSAVQHEIGGSGRVRSWQGAYVGSRGGYAAARPKAKTWAEAKGTHTYSTAGPKRYAVGQLTNAVNGGHRTPKNKWGFRTSGKTIQGKQFYQRAQIQAATVAQETAEQIVQALMNHLEG